MHNTVTFHHNKILVIVLSYVCTLLSCTAQHAVDIWVIPLYNCITVSLSVQVNTNIKLQFCLYLLCALTTNNLFISHFIWIFNLFDLVKSSRILRILTCLDITFACIRTWKPLFLAWTPSCIAPFTLICSSPVPTQLVGRGLLSSSALVLLSHPQWSSMWLWYFKCFF